MSPKDFWDISLKNRVEKVHLELLGVAPKYARAPGGIWKSMAAAKLGWPLIQWSAQGSDMVEGERSAQAISDMVIGTSKDGEIILMHDMKRVSVDASKIFIPRMQERGYLFLTIDELFAKDGVALQPDTPYWCCMDGVTTTD